MKPFMDADFLLENDVAKKLYHEYAENMPIYDYHCHISPRMIYENHKFENIGELMLGGDHYKWRVMLSNGVDDRLCRGDASWFDKWMAFASSLKYCIGNPMYHWTHLELRRVFGIEEILSEKTAKDIWDRANAMLATEEFRCRGLIRKFGVKVICTTDDPVDDLEHQIKLGKEPDLGFKVYPAWRPDKVINIERGGFVEYMNRLSRVSGIHCLNLENMMKALEIRLDYFHACGARLSDHALDTVPYGVPSTHIAGEAFRKALSGAPLTEAEIESYKTYVLVELARMYKERGWVQQYHIGAMRNNNPRMFEKYGPDVGFDSIDDTCIAENLSHLLAEEERTDNLPKTILYCLNPKDNYVIGTMLGNFQGDGIPGKIQFGSGWWFCDQQFGMIEQMKSLAALGLLGRFVGMLTDSRSFISYPRHEYFRRILCNLIGHWVENGEYPEDYEVLGELVQGICYNNAVKYFGMDVD
ncbi:MAG: glucuronate isomerase [Clostridiales bacterium]|nr:glucuronate isomerase [Clostridiales bacterium]